MTRTRLPDTEKQSVQFNIKVNMRDASLIRAAAKMEGDRYATSFIYRIVVIAAENILEKRKKAVLDNATVRQQN